MTREQLSLTFGRLRVDYVVERHSEPPPIDTTGEATRPAALRPLARCLPQRSALRLVRSA